MKILILLTLTLTTNVFANFFLTHEVKGRMSGLAVNEIAVDSSTGRLILNFKGVLDVGNISDRDISQLKLEYASIDSLDYRLPENEIKLLRLKNKALLNNYLTLTQRLTSVTPIGEQFKKKVCYGGRAGHCQNYIAQRYSAFSELELEGITFHPTLVNQVEYYYLRIDYNDQN